MSNNQTSYDFLDKDGLERLVQKIKMSFGNTNYEVAEYDESVALYSHSVDEFVYFNGVLYKVTNAINVGDSIAVGVNITSDTGIEDDSIIFINNIEDSGDTYNAVFILKSGALQEYGNTKSSGGGTTIVQLPQADTSVTYTYNGSEQEFVFSSIDTNNTIITGNYRTTGGTSTVTVSLKSSSSVWSDLSNSPKTFTWIISPFDLGTPTVSGGPFTYDGNEKSISITGLNNNIPSGAITYSGDNAATNAGSYTYTLTITDTNSCIWTGGGTNPVDISWSIAKASPNLTINPSSFTFNSNSTNGNLDVSWSGNGTVTISSSDTSVVTVSPNTLNSPGTSIASSTGKSGSATITVSLSESVNYLSGSTTCSVNCQFITLKSFAAATIDEIKEMVKAADEGQIDLYDDCGWRVGQEKTISLPAIAASGTYSGQSWTVGESQAAQSVTLVLMHKGLYELVTPVMNKSGASRSTCSFVVGLKNCLTTAGYMNSSNTNSGSWESSARKAWCNGGFRQAMESIFGTGIFKQFKTITASTYNGSTNQTSNDYFALPAAAEVFKGDSSYGSGGTAGQQTAYSNLTEFNALTRFTYYETTANRVKKLGSSGSATSWWERSPYYNNATNFCRVNSNGNADANGASSTNGLAPFGCL